MQAIITTFKKTNKYGGKLVATIASGHSIELCRWDSDDCGAQHKKAAQCLCDKMDWQGELVSAVTTTGWAHIMIPRMPQEPLDITAKVAALFPGQDPIRAAAAFVDIKKALTA